MKSEARRTKKAWVQTKVVASKIKKQESQSPLVLRQLAHRLFTLKACQVSKIMADSQVFDAVKFEEMSEFHSEGKLSGGVANLLLLKISQSNIAKNHDLIVSTESLETIGSSKPRLRAINDDQQCRLESAKRLFVPIFSKEHWLLAVVDVDLGRILIYDSLKDTSKSLDQGVAKLIRSLKNLLAKQWENSRFIVKQQNYRRQNNHFDCGYYMMAAVIDILKGKELQASKDTMDKIRGELLLFHLTGIHREISQTTEINVVCLYQELADLDWCQIADNW